MITTAAENIFPLAEGTMRAFSSCSPPVSFCSTQSRTQTHSNQTRVIDALEFHRWWKSNGLPLRCGLVLWCRLLANKVLRHKRTSCKIQGRGGPICRIMSTARCHFSVLQ
ncbi:hypothetical protein AOLI_G00034520 [Acnodon oligacanthus]